MGAVVLGTVGRVVGGAFFGPFGAIVGGVLGAAVGGALDRPDAQRNSATPMADLRVVGTDYGQPIPWIRGACRVAGQMWWNTDRRVIRSVERSGGDKGGGPPAQETETIVYEIDVLFGLTANPIYGIGRIWDNGKLIWTNSSLSDAGSVMSSGATENWRRMTVYTGAEDQLPDPAYEAAVGVGNAPAYIGRGTVFIEGLQLGSSGAVRNLTFEVFVDGQMGGLLQEWFGADTYGIGQDAGSVDDIAYDGRYLWLNENVSEAGGAHIFDPYTKTFLPKITHPAPFSKSQQGGVAMTMNRSRNAAYINVSNASKLDTLVYRTNDRTLLGPLSEMDRILLDGRTCTIIAATDESILVWAADARNNPFYVWYVYRIGADGAIESARPPKCRVPGFAGLDNVFAPKGRGIRDAEGVWWFYEADTANTPWATGIEESTPHHFRAIGIGPVWLGDEFGSDYPDQFGTSTFDVGADSFAANPSAFKYDPSRNCIYYFSANYRWLKKFDCATQTATRLNSVAYIGTGDTPTDSPNYMSGASIEYAADIDRILLLRGGNPGKRHVHVVNPASGESETVIDIPLEGDGSDHFSIGGQIAYTGGAVWGRSILDAPTAGNAGIGTIGLGVSANCPSYAEVQAAICDRCGLTPDQYDVSDLDSITRRVCSLPWSQVSPGRDPTGRLMSSGYYELTVSDKLYFRVRGGAPVALIEFDELGAVEGSGPSGEPLPLKQATDIELPAKVALSYANLDNDYQPDTQESDRMVSAVAGTVDTMTLSMGFEPGEAKAIANTISKDRVVALVSTQINVLGHHALLQPTDVILVKGQFGETYRMRAVKTRDAFPVIGIDAVLDDASVLSQIGITDLDYTSSTTVNPPVRSVMELMDIPLLRDEDDYLGPYVATKGSGTPYAGTAVFKSANDIDFERVATVNESAVIGFSTTALTDWLGPRVFDERSTVTVNAGRGTLAASTRDILLNSATNAMLIGDEIVQFRKAELLVETEGGEKVYRLSGFLRGCRGTEWAMTGHASGERCVLLTMAGLRKLQLPNTELGLSRYYRGVTLGRAISTADSEEFTTMGVAQLPFAPVDLRVSRDNSNNITFTWQRRSRYAVRMIGAAGINVPLAESSESYQVRIYSSDSDTAVLRTIPASTPTATYSAAQQTADGLTPGDLVNVGIAQVSATVGRGRELREAL